MQDLIYDYAIIGAGAAGLQLAYELVSDSYFDESHILLIDKVAKEGNDHTWSFWETKGGRYDDILWSSWGTGAFYGKDISTKFELDPYQYKTLRSNDFYSFMRSSLEKANNITWIQEEVLSAREVNNLIEIGTNFNNHRARHCFDSRISVEFDKTKASYINILQHFKGFFIKVNKPVFDPSNFIMMDYRLQYKDHTSFTYVLPKSATEAMIEFTLFDHALLKDEEYDQYLNRYIQEYLGIEEFEIIEKEFGVIPMSTYPFYKDHTDRITKIGTAGGWVRASSGYAFHNSFVNAKKIKNNLIQNRKPTKGINDWLQRWMDEVFLGVLDKENNIGSSVFQAIYSNNSIQETFRFMNEDSSLIQKIKMIYTVPWGPFLRSLGRWMVKRM